MRVSWGLGEFPPTARAFEGYSILSPFFPPLLFMRYPTATCGPIQPHPQLAFSREAIYPVPLRRFRVRSFYGN